MKYFANNILFQSFEAMAIIKSVLGKSPVFGVDCYLAENATVVGEVVMGDHCSVWFNAVVRGDVHYIRMGHKVYVQYPPSYPPLTKKHPPTLATTCP